MATNVPGGWMLEKVAAVQLPTEVNEGFQKTVKCLQGADYTPVLYVGHQVVSGMNYMLICHQRPATLNPVEHFVKVVLHKSIEGEWLKADIEEIV